MSPPPKPDNEEARLAALHGFDILDSEPERAFDDLVRIAAGICGVPMAAVTLIDRDLYRFAQIWAAAGHPYGVFSLAPQDLEKLTGAPVADVVKDAA